MSGNAMTPGVRARKVKKVVGQVPDDQVTCRVWRHKWAVWDLVKGVPKALKVHRTPQGDYQLTEVCERCGARERMLTLVGGVFDQNAVLSYRDVKDGNGVSKWVSVPRDDLNVTMSDFKAEFFGRAADLLKAAAR
jgi:hypothetical protein